MDPAAPRSLPLVNETSHKIKPSHTSSIRRPTSNITMDDHTCDGSNDPYERFFHLLQVISPLTNSTQLSTDPALTGQPHCQISAQSLKSAVSRNEQMENVSVLSRVSSGIIQNKAHPADEMTSKISSEMTANDSGGNCGKCHLPTSGVFDDTNSEISNDLIADVSDAVTACISDKMSDDLSEDLSGDLLSINMFHKTNSSTNIIKLSCTLDKSAGNLKNRDVDFQIIEVTLSRPYYQLLADIRRLSEPWLKLLRQHSIIGRLSTFESLSSDLSGFTLKQCYHDWQRNNGSLEVMQAALYVDTMIRVVECIAGSSLHCAITWLETRRQMSKRLSDKGLNTIERLLTAAESRLKLEIHPKILRVSVVIRQHLNERSEDCEVKVLIIVKNNRDALVESMINVIENIEGIRVCTVAPASVCKNIDDWLNSHNCYILEESQLVTSPLLPSATLLIEYDYFNQSQCPSLCKSLEKRFVGLKTAPNDWTAVLSELSTEENKSSEMLTKCSTEISKLSNEQQIVVIASVSVTRMKGLLEALESVQSIEVIDRDYASMQERAYRETGKLFLQFEDIAIDHQTCIVLQDTVTLSCKDALEVLVIKVAALQCKFQSCWVLLYSGRHAKLGDLDGNRVDNKNYIYDVDYISKLEGTLSLLATKLDDYRVKTVHCPSYNTLAEIVRTIGLRSAIDAPNTDDRLNGKWIMEDPSKDEIWLLVNFTCLNSFSAQIVLKYFGSREALMNNREPEHFHAACPQLSERIRYAFLKIKEGNVSNTTEFLKTKEKAFSVPMNDFRHLEAELPRDRSGNDVISGCNQSSRDVNLILPVAQNCQKLDANQMCNIDESQSKSSKKTREISNSLASVNYDQSQHNEHDSSRSAEFNRHCDITPLNNRGYNDCFQQPWDDGSSYQPEGNEMEGVYYLQSQSTGDSCPLGSEVMKQHNEATQSNFNSPNECLLNDDNEGEGSEASISWSPNTHNDSDITDSVASDCEETKIMNCDTLASTQINQEAYSQPNNEFLRSIAEVGRAQLLFNTNSDHLNNYSSHKLSKTGRARDTRGPCSHAEFSESCFDKSQDVVYQKPIDCDNISGVIEKKKFKTASGGWNVMCATHVRDDLSRLEDAQSRFNPCDVYSRCCPSTPGVDITCQRSDIDLPPTSHTACSTGNNNRGLIKNIQSLCSTVNTSAPQAVPALMQFNQRRYVDGSQRASSKREIACVTPNVRVPIRALSLTTGSCSTALFVTDGPTTGVNSHPSQPGVSNSINIESVRRKDFLECYTACGVTSTPASSSKSRKRTCSTNKYQGCHKSSDNDVNNMRTLHSNISRNEHVGSGRNEMCGHDVDYFESRGYLDAHGRGENVGAAAVRGMMKEPCKRSRLTYQRDCTLKGGQTRLTFI